MNDMIDRLNTALEGRYRIERELGEGGMATVFLAEDVRHHRKVALKVLKPELAAVVGAKRFLAEIEVTANLQHPNILPLFDSGEADSYLFYVMPYVEGESLRDRLDREHQLPVSEAVRLCTEVAEALDHAHRQGVIHRDIKPANILLRDGRPLVADFGIALAVDAAAGTRLTETGFSIGTPYYMSPEQATGDQHVGGQSDVYSLACVLYEMLTGNPPFTGSTAQAVLGKILRGGPVSATEVRPTVPAHVDAAIRRALEKLPADRFETARHFADALGDPSFRHGVTTAVDQAAISRWRRRSRIYGTAAVILALFGAWLVFQPEADSDRPVTRLSVRIPDDQDFAGDGRFTLSPDGMFMVYQGPSDRGGFRLWLRRWDALTATPVQDSEGARDPAISPDGEELAFITGNMLRVVPVRGGNSRMLADDARQQAAWSADGRWLYYNARETRGISRVPAGGGTSERITVVDPESGRGGHLWPRALPDPSHILIEIDHGDADSVGLVDVATGAIQPLFPGDFPVYSRTGHIVYAIPGTPRPQLMAVAFDLKKREVSGDPVPAATDLIPAVGGWYFFGISETGRLIFRGASSLDALADLWAPVWVDREGAVQVVDPSWRFSPGYNNRGMSISPDGQRVAVSLPDASGEEDIWIKELPRGPFSRLTTSPVEDARPKWTEDGRSIIYISRRGQGSNPDGGSDVWVRRADGIGEPTLLLDHTISIWEAEVSPGGQWILGRVGGLLGVAGERDIIVRGPGDTVAVPVLESGFDEKAIALSPDGRWLAYESDETGRNEIYIRPFPDVRSGKFPVSQSGGVMPVWANTRNELYFVDQQNQLVAATYQGGERFRVLELTALFEVPSDLLFNRSEFYALYDTTPDDQRFIWLQSTVDQADRELILVDNWSASLDRATGPR